MSDERRAAELLDLLRLEACGENVFRGRSGNDGWLSVFGGQLLAQGIVAGATTVAAERTLHALHGSFVRAGRFQTELRFHVLRDRDGRNFSLRRVLVTQDDALLMTLEMSFQTRAPSAEANYHPPMPSVAGPEASPSIRELGPGHFSHIAAAAHPHVAGSRPIERRPVKTDGSAMASGTCHQWCRFAARLPDEAAYHHGALAYISDMMPMDTILRRFHTPETPGRWTATSLNHAMWFHDDCRADEWLMYSIELLSAGNGRGLVKGTIHTQDGRLAATVVQEGLLRPVQSDRQG